MKVGLLRNFKEDQDVETNEELKDLAIKECEKIPSNNTILYKSEEISHVIERKRGCKINAEVFQEKHVITIEWIQIQDKESEG